MSCLQVDVSIGQAGRVTLSEVEALDALEPYGAGNARPVFCLRGATLERVQNVGQNRHLKLRLSKGSAQFDGIFFSAVAQTCGVVPGDRVDAAFYLQINEFRSSRTVQLQMVDIRPSLSGSAREEESLQLVGRCLQGQELRPRDAVRLLPSRDQCVCLWRALQHTVPPDGLEADYLPLLRRLSGALHGAEPFLRTALCLEVFRERGLLQSLRQGDSIRLHLTGQGKKVALDRSEYLLRLHQALDAAKGGGTLMTVEERYQHLEDTVRAYNPTASFDKIRAAYEFAAAAHQGQLRKDGSPFVTHPLAVAQIVAEELHLDSESIEAALLHDTIEDTAATHEDIAKQFSPTVADLVEGVSKLTRVHYTSKAQEQMENLRKMLLAMSKDIRVILIKVSDRLHNMRTMEYQTPEKQKQKSFETLEIYAPIAHRLGMQKMKWELEDLSLKYLDPISYREIVDALNEKAAEYDGFMSSIHDQITQRLHESNIDGYVYGRMKHPYSIYRKMYTQNKSLDDVYDLFAFRVIVDTVSDCYYVLGIIHDLYKPVLGRFKDYIGTPKPNMYQSLHTTVMGQNGIPFEVQIRTKEMHEVAEYGIAAHWKYKQNGQGGGDEGRYEWVRRLLENQEGTDAEEFIHSLKVDMFADEVFVFTPGAT